MLLYVLFLDQNIQKMVLPLRLALLAFVCVQEVAALTIIGVKLHRGRTAVLPPVAMADASATEQIVSFSDSALAQLAELRKKQGLDEIRCRSPSVSPCLGSPLL